MIGRYRSPACAQVLPGVCALALAGACMLSACGSSTSTSSTAAPRTGHIAAAPLGHPTQATLILDFTPNAVHAGIYRALAAGYYRDENIDLRVVEPTSTQETLKLIDAGRAQFGLADGSDVGGLIDAGGDARAVMALVQRPLGGLIALASEHLRSPGGWRGGRWGSRGCPPTWRCSTPSCVPRG